MKNPHFSIIKLFMIIFLGLITSCESPDEPESVKNYLVDVNLNKKTLAAGDTLILSLHVKDGNISLVKIEFSDSILKEPEKVYSVTFANPENGSGKVINHIFSTAGSYKIRVESVKGNTTEKQEFEILVNPRYFAFSMEVGMKWEYSYNYVYSVSPNSPFEKTGTRYWKVISKETTYYGTLYTVQQIRHELITRNYLDSTITDTTNLCFSFAANNIQFSLEPLQTGYNSFVVPNNTKIDSYPIKVRCVFDNCGIEGFYYQYIGMGILELETLKRISFQRQ